MAKKYLDFFKKKSPVHPIHKVDTTKDKKSPAKKNRWQDISFFSYSKFSVKKQTFFAKRLSFLIKAGVPMLESMYVIKKQAKSKSEIGVFEKIIADIANGHLWPHPWGVSREYLEILP